MSQQNYARIANMESAPNTHKIYSNGDFEWCTIYFKIAGTTDIIYYNVPIKWSITKFLKTIEQWITTDFNLANLQNHTIEIIETGQEIHGIKPENAPKICSGELTYQEQFLTNNRNNWPSFYIKIICQ